MDGTRTDPGKRTAAKKRILYLDHMPDGRGRSLVARLSDKFAVRAQAGLATPELGEHLLKAPCDALVTTLPPNAAYLKWGSLGGHHSSREWGFAATGARYLGEHQDFSLYRKMRGWDGMAGTSIARTALSWIIFRTRIATIVYTDLILPPKSLKSPPGKVVRQTTDEAGDLRRIEEFLSPHGFRGEGIEFPENSGHVRFGRREGFLTASIRVGLENGVVSGPACVVARLAAGYPAPISLEKEDFFGDVELCEDARSIMGIMVLAICKGVSLTVRAPEGPGAESALRAICGVLSPADFPDDALRYWRADWVE